MPSVPRLTSQVAKVHVNYPILTSPSYITFIKHTTTLGARNADALAKIARPTFDAEYQRQLQREYGHDDKICRMSTEEMNSKAVTKMWESLKARFNQKQPGGSESSVLADGVERFKLPTVGSHYKSQSGKGQKNERWLLQNYEGFARKAEHLNADVTFTKQLMDDAFRRAIAIATRYGRNSNKYGVSTSEIDKVLARCLGPESEKYWEGRGGDE